MACNASKLPFIRAISTRSYASAQAKPAPVAPKKQSLTSCALPNKVLVSSIDNGSPVARITVAYKAGSRYEPADELGLSHILRVAAGNTTNGASIFAITRNLQQLGANLSATVDREVVTYTLEASKDNLEQTVDILKEVASNQVFQPWEFDIIIPKIKYEVAGLAPQVRVMDLLHKAAFRRGLGNSLFCAPRKIGSASSESMQRYVSQTFTPSRCSVAAVGLSQERTVAVAQSLNLVEASGALATPSTFKEAELRKEMGGKFAHVAIAAKGAAITNVKESLALAILAKAISSGPQVQWGADNSPLGKALAAEVSGAPFGASAFNISYTDTGLLGVFVSVPKEHAGKAVQAAAKVLKGAARIGGDSLQRGRTQLIAEILSVGDTPSMLVENLAAGAVLTGQVLSPAELAEEASKVTDSDISTIAGKVLGSQYSMAAVGALLNVPYLDELK